VQFLYRLAKQRVGQGTFRVNVSDAYDWACSVTHGHSLPALDAAHIRPVADNGPNDVANGLLLRADLHRLFDHGYLTVTPDLHLEVSPRLRDDYSNGKSYYPLHGSVLHVPDDEALRPAPEFRRWHNEERFRHRAGGRLC
jgi:putative restriction endonuclease